MRKLCLKLFDYTECVSACRLRRMKLIAYRSKIDSTVSTAIQRLGELFYSFHRLFLLMILLDDEEFKKRLKRVYLMIAESSPDRYRLGNHEATRQILEFHGFGLSLLTTDCVRLRLQNSRLKIGWSIDMRLPEDHVRELGKSLRLVLSGLKYVDAIPIEN